MPIREEYNRVASDPNGLFQSDYDFSYKYFPSDLTNDYVGHYMVININVPTDISGNPRSVYNGSSFQNLMTPGEFSKVDTLRFGGGGQQDTLAGVTSFTTNAIAGAPGAPSSEALSLPRFTRRIKESVALFMPNSIVHSSQNIYEEVSLTNIAGKVASVGISALAGLAGGAAGRSISGVAGLAGAASNILGATGQVVSRAASLAGYPINPRIEVLYTTTPQRQYVFEVLMAPRNEFESKAIDAIIKTLRFHAAPEIDSKTKGFTYIPPAEFDITFFNKGEENTKIHRINTCVLERIETDFAPAGTYSTFSNGYPVAIRLSMAFREIEVVHKQRVLQGF